MPSNTNKDLHSRLAQQLNANTTLSNCTAGAAETVVKKYPADWELLVQRVKKEDYCGVQLSLKKQSRENATLSAICKQLYVYYQLAGSSAEASLNTVSKTNATPSWKGANWSTKLFCEQYPSDRPSVDIYNTEADLSPLVTWVEEQTTAFIAEHEESKDIENALQAADAVTSPEDIADAQIRQLVKNGMILWYLANAKGSVYENIAAVSPEMQKEAATFLSQDSTRKQTAGDLRKKQTSPTSENTPAHAVTMEEPLKEADKLQALNTILYGPPGTGKTYHTKRYAVATCGGCEESESINAAYLRLVGEGRIRFVTFHQSYGYEEFIQGIAAEVKDKEVKYSPKDGVFVEFCKMAAENSDRNYVFIIDEINRGNISKIFGELITLIEDTKRTGKNDEQRARLPHGGEFSVPSNVYLLGTMNTADRSIALLDTALRRRFSFKEMLPQASLLEKITVEKVNIKTLLESMNNRIEFLFDREHTIGHAFFMPLLQKASKDVLTAIFRDKVIPLLQEYFYEDYENIQLVLGKSFVEEKKVPVSLQNRNMGKRYTLTSERQWNFSQILEDEKKDASTD